MKPSTHERKKAYAESFDETPNNWRAAVEFRLNLDGIGWLTDEQVSQIVSDMASRARFSQRVKVRNRNALKGAAA